MTTLREGQALERFKDASKGIIHEANEPIRANETKFGVFVALLHNIEYDNYTAVIFNTWSDRKIDDQICFDNEVDAVLLYDRVIGILGLD